MKHLSALVLICLTGLLFLSTQVFSDHAPITKSLWDHNGSEMVLEAHGQDRRIYYWNARPGLAVAQGTVLFVGQRRGNWYEGNARLYRDGCEPAEYWVTGSIGEELDFTLYGSAPVREGCTIVGYRDDSANSVLRFTYIRRLDY